LIFCIANIVKPLDQNQSIMTDKSRLPMQIHSHNRFLRGRGFETWVETHVSSQAFSDKLFQTSFFRQAFSDKLF